MRLKTNKTYEKIKVKKFWRKREKNIRRGGRRRRERERKKQSLLSPL